MTLSDVCLWHDIWNSIQNANFTYAHAHANTDRFKRAWEKVGTTRFWKPGPMNKQYFVIYPFIYIEWLHCTVEIFSANPHTSLHDHRNKRKENKQNVASLQFISIFELKCPGNPKDLELSRRFSWFLVSSTIKMTAKALNISPVAENVDLMRSVKRRWKRSQCGFATPAKIVFHSYLYQQNASVFAESFNRSIQSQ